MLLVLAGVSVVCVMGRVGLVSQDIQVLLTSILCLVYSVLPKLAVSKHGVRCSIKDVYILFPDLCQGVAFLILHFNVFNAT